MFSWIPATSSCNFLDFYGTFTRGKRCLFKNTLNMGTWTLFSIWGSHWIIATRYQRMYAQLEEAWCKLSNSCKSCFWLFIIIALYQYIKDLVLHNYNQAQTAIINLPSWSVFKRLELWWIEKDATHTSMPNQSPWLVKAQLVSLSMDACVRNPSNPTWNLHIDTWRQKF